MQCLLQVGSDQDCQEYKDCPGNCQNDQGCKDACALKNCYYYHCDNYRVSAS